jgi:hypothetical protein
MNSNHTWRFFRAGGFDQVRLDSGSDLASLEDLDQKLWVALACPTTGLEFDSRTLGLIDTDQDGRIRPPELIAAVKWAVASLKNPDDLLKSSSELPLSAVNDATPEGQQLLSSARQILINLGKKDAAAITLEDTADTAKIFAQTQFNGDGIVPLESAPDDATKAVLADIVTCLSPETDRSGKPGVSQPKVDLFFAEAQAYSDWWKKAEGNTSIMPFAAATPVAAAAFQAVKTKIDDYFTRCRLASFDPRSLSALNREEKEYLVFAAKDLTLASTEIAGFPLAQVAPGKPLPLTEGLNPAWAERTAQFRAEVVKPMLNGKADVSESDWLTIKARFAEFETWLGSKTGALVEKLTLPRVREILAGKSKETITGLIAKDKALEPEANTIVSVERLIRYHRDLYKLVNNFVSFHDFYSRRGKAIFQAGTLFLDQRSCELCLMVADPGKHAVMATLSGTYLAYCDCTRKGSADKKQIVAAFTNGDSDNLMVGRNGVFYDRQGQDWDATITKIVDNPISVRQAFWSPYKRAVRAVQQMIAKRAASADEASAAKLTQVAAKLEQSAAAPKPADQPKPKLDPGMIAALGVGAAGAGGMIGGIMTGFLQLKGLMPLGVIVILLLISGPSMILAWLKLRKRNLAPILDSNGWAVNAKAKLNIPFGASLTQVAVLPPGSQCDKVDPFAEKRRPWGLYLTLLILVALALCWWLGVFDSFLPEKIRSASVRAKNSQTNAPAGNAPTAPAAASAPEAPPTNAAPAAPAK